jgi:hypothetical protein
MFRQIHPVSGETIREGVTADDIIRHCVFANDRTLPSIVARIVIEIEAGRMTGQIECDDGTVWAKD